MFFNVAGGKWFPLLLRCGKFGIKGSDKLLETTFHQQITGVPTVEIHGFVFPLHFVVVDFFGFSSGHEFFNHTFFFFGHTGFFVDPFDFPRFVHDFLFFFRDDGGGFGTGFFVDTTFVSPTNVLVG